MAAISVWDFVKEVVNVQTKKMKEFRDSQSALEANVREAEKRIVEIEKLIKAVAKIAEIEKKVEYLSAIQKLQEEKSKDGKFVEFEEETI